MTTASSRFIQDQSPSKRLPISEDQAALLVSLIATYTEDLCRLFNLPQILDLNLNNHEAARELRSYEQLILGAYACGFVCIDLDVNFDLSNANQNPETMIGNCNLSVLRHYLHTLLRSERVSGLHGSPILASLQSGALGLVASRLKSDQRLRPEADMDR